MVVDVAASAVGLALSLLCKAIEEVIRKCVIDKIVEFNPLLKKINTKLKTVKPGIEEIEKSNLELDRTGELKDFKQVIEDITALVRKLQEVPHWYKKPKYTDKLKELDESLDTQIMLLQVPTASKVSNLSVITSIIEGDTRNIRMQMGNMSVQVGSMSMQMENMGMQIEDLNTNLEMIRDMRQNGLVQNQVKGCWSGVPEPPSFTVGLDLRLDELKKKLLEDGVSMGLVTGHPGSGKTTLAKALCQDKKVKDKFKGIIFVDVSKRPNTEVVQEICEKKGTQILSFQSEEIALDRLQQLLNNTEEDPVLLVLDNVWPGNRTESLLASFRFKESEMSNYKILVTSRYMLPGFDVEYHVEELNDNDAMSLLRNSARLTSSSSIPEDLQRQVVECCKRLPLAIEVVGRSLFGKNIVIWKDRVEAWSSGSSVIKSEKHLLVCLQSSLDALGEENALIKECFMDLASFPQGRRIPASVLIDIWSVLIDMWAADKDSSCVAKLYELTYWRLANLVITRNEKGEVDDYYGEHFVTQHDLLRELAVHQTDEGPVKLRRRLIINIRGNKLPKWWKKQMDQPFEEVLLVSISTDGLFSSKWRDIQLPKAKVLVLNFHTKNYALPEFVKKMEKLKVLIVTNYGFLPAEVSNFTLLGSSSKLKRIRLERISLSSITKNPIVLKRLQKISFFMCNMGQAFSKGSIKFFEAFPDLQEINIDYCSDLVELPADICLLIHLKKLSITNCHKLSALPKMIGELVNLEVLRLRSCTDLSELPSSVRKLKKLKVLDISNCYSIKELPEHIGEMCCLQKLNMRQCSRMQELPESILDLETLTDVICDEETKLFWETYLPSLSNHIQITAVKEEINLDWL
ncbi:putative powdery mildew resistance protein, RPW8 [Rosa chinensis]|uniref:Putative powdery mildew resistance protein, RPW8 n=1 Tax=Rosa chinensis TaxID=74649 RepID=A0A2P6QVP7_ROSCH|nr:probable disease resistance protein At5g66900 [Rosa chinensis]PRQ38234.1 putative powdery mildew resistance protein, RPW8 [Rosa chinensis]